MVKKTGRNENICMSCLKTFSDKDIYWVRRNNEERPDSSYQVLYCSDCIAEHGVTEFGPYLKPRKKSEKTKTTTEKKTIKKKTTKDDKGL